MTGAWAPKAATEKSVGLQFANVPPLIGNLVIQPWGGVDGMLFLALRTTLSLDDALDLAECDIVGRSHGDG